MASGWKACGVTHSLTATLDQLRVVASSTSNDPGPRSRQHQQIGQRLLPLAAANVVYVHKLHPTFFVRANAGILHCRAYVVCCYWKFAIAYSNSSAINFNTVNLTLILWSYTHFLHRGSYKCCSKLLSVTLASLNRF